MNMEFKKPQKTSRQRPEQPGSPAPTYPRAVPRPAPSLQTAPPPSLHTPPTPKRELPQKQSLTTRLRYAFRQKKTITILLVSAVMMVIVVIYIMGYNTATNSNDTAASSQTVESLEYQTILPDGKSISDLGGWKRVSPTKSEPVYAYTDTLGGISINVSQQPLPESFIGDTDDQVAELAKKFSATNKINAGGITAYVGTSSKGPQSAIFTKNSLLVLIKSQEKIDDTSWATYIKSLN